MTPVFADAFYYLAFLNADDSAHERAVEAMLSLDAPIITTTWVLTEVADGVAAPARRGYFQALYEKIRADRHTSVVAPSMELFEEGMAFYARYQDKEWSLTDCISFLVMRRCGAQDALTADRHFEQAGFHALLK